MSISLTRHAHRPAEERCSNHASVRMQQRRVTREVIDLLHAHGEQARSHGAYVYYFSRRAKCRVSGVLSPGELRTIEEYRSCYLIEADDGVIVTVGHRYKRIRRKG
jgi:hypothetical protein